MKYKGQKLLILGANAETAKLVETAQTLGIYTIVTDNIHDSIAKKVADKAYDVDGMDIEGLVNLAKEENVSGVVVGTADPLLPSYYKVCKALNLPCYITEKSLKVFTNKKALKDFCKDFGVDSVPEYSLESVIADENILYPIVIKPVDGRSGKGIRVCYTKEYVKEAIEYAKKESQCGQVLIERYMQCDDVFMYYTFKNGNYYLSAMADRFTCKEQQGCAPVVLGAVYPSKYADLYMDKVHAKMCQIFKALDIENGVFLIQAFVEQGHFYVYDPGFRLQGAAPHILIDRINGFDHRKMLINFALTENMGESDLDKKNDYMFSRKVPASQVVLLKKGKIRKIIGIDSISRLPQVISSTQRLFEGDEVLNIGTEQQVLVRFHIVCDTREELRKIIAYINRTIHVLDTVGNEMCLTGLAPAWIEGK